MADSEVFHQVLKKIESARSKAARFCRADLHVHTIESHDFPSIHDKEGFVSDIHPDEQALTGKSEDWQGRFVDRAREAGLGLVAVTDHNEANIAEALSKRSDAELTILPGIEVSLNTTIFPGGQVHVLGIFPQGTSAKDIERIFPPGCGMPPSGKRDEKAATNQELSELIEAIRGLGGIAVAAHVSSDKGVRVVVHSQHVEWLEKNYVRKVLKAKDQLSESEQRWLAKVDQELKPLDDAAQNKYLEYLADHDFEAIQIQRPEHVEHYRGEHVSALGLRPFACLMATDAHTLADIGCRGHASHIKLSEKSLIGLRKALRDPGTRIRFDTNVPEKKVSRILGLVFEGGSFDGEVVGFSDNLTTLIGGRGTGKSALIEAIRFALDKGVADLPDRLRVDLEERRGFTLRGTTVKLVFDPAESDKLVVKRAIHDPGPGCFSVAGETRPEINPSESVLLRAEVYGWSEIEELTESHRRQLGLLDRTTMDAAELKLEIDGAIEDLRGNSDKAVSLAREIETLLPHVQTAAEVRSQLEDLSSPELDSAFEDFDRNSAASAVLTSAQLAVEEDLYSWAKDDDGNLRDLSGIMEKHAKAIEEGLSEYDWAGDLANDIRKRIEHAQSTYSALIDELDSLSELLQVRDAEIDVERQGIEAQLSALAEQIGEKDHSAALSRRKKLTDELSAIQHYEEEIESRGKGLKDILGPKRKSIRARLEKARGALLERRKEKASRVSKQLAALPAGQDVRIDVVEYGDTDDYKAALGRTDGAGYSGVLKGIEGIKYMAKGYPAFYAGRFSPRELVDIALGPNEQANLLDINYVRNRESSELVDLAIGGEIDEEVNEIVVKDAGGGVRARYDVEGHERVSDAKGMQVWQHLSPYFMAGGEQEYPDPEKLQRLLSLETERIDDLPVISLDGRPISGLSPGQRCSAVLPIILVEGDWPLVIDQPEDNLDNKLVFDLVVDILRDLKEKRQIILATHNPNIPVSGDAEQVVVLEAPSRNRCRVAAQASIDDDTIVENIKAIMEGGEEAFEMRARKYGALK